MAKGVAQIALGRPLCCGWSVGNRRHLTIGSRVFLVRQARPPKGIVASGYTASEPEPTNDPDDHANYCGVNFTMVLRGEEGDILPVEVLQADPVLEEVNWGPRRGGIELTPDQAARLEDMWSEFLAGVGKTELLI